VDPSLWWDNLTLLNASRTLLAKKKFQGTSLLLGYSSGTVDIEMDMNKLSADTTDNDIKFIRTILQLIDSLKSYKKKGLRFQAKYYKDNEHNTVSLIANYDALRFIFNDYTLKISAQDIADSSIDLLAKFKQHYSDISKQMGCEVKPPGNTINDIGYRALSEKRFKKAEAFFTYNLNRFPGSYKVYEAMGDFYTAVGDTTKAVSNYKKSLSIEEVTDIRKKLEKVQGK
jgi:hypothetical protein